MIKPCVEQEPQQRKVQNRKGRPDRIFLAKVSFRVLDREMHNGEENHKYQDFSSVINTYDINSMIKGQ